MVRVPRIVPPPVKPSHDEQLILHTTRRDFGIIAVIMAAIAVAARVAMAAGFTISQSVAFACTMDTFWGRLQMSWPLKMS